MTSLRNILATALILFLLGGNSLESRPISNMPYGELQEKSDLVVIATPTASEDTKERAVLPGFGKTEMIGRKTKFRVAAVLKGEKSVKELVLHHYRSDGSPVPNGPMLVSFAPDKGTYLLFLKREPDGRYAPTTGQMDPAFQCVHSLSGTLAPAH